MQIGRLSEYRYNANTKSWGHQEYKIPPFPRHWTVCWIHVLKFMKMHIFTKQEREDWMWQFPTSRQEYSVLKVPTFSFPLEYRSRWKTSIKVSLENMTSVLGQIRRPPHKDRSSSVGLMVWLRADDKEVGHVPVILWDHYLEKTLPEGLWGMRELKKATPMETAHTEIEVVSVSHQWGRIPQFCL